MLVKLLPTMNCNWCCNKLQFYPTVLII